MGCGCGPWITKCSLYILCIFFHVHFLLLFTKFLSFLVVYFQSMMSFKDFLIKILYLVHNCFKFYLSEIVPFMSTFVLMNTVTFVRDMNSFTTTPNYLTIGHYSSTMIWTLFVSKAPFCVCCSAAMHI